jgi:hypothetical protein
MVINKSLDELELIATLLCDAHASFRAVFNTRALNLTLRKVKNRARSEGLGFLTKTLPRLGKHLDQVLAGMAKLNPPEYGFKTIPGTKLPRFLGELFSLVFHPDGSVLQQPDAHCVKHIRLVLYSYSKYELPYSDEQEQKVLSAFVNAEDDLRSMSSWLATLHSRVNNSYNNRRKAPSLVQDLIKDPSDSSLDFRTCVARESRILLAKLFSMYDPTDIVPRHGPGVVATKQRLSEKFRWTNVSSRITEVYPLDAYFCASPGHVCDTYDTFSRITDTSHPAQVLLVPKDSRGPRLISCEPVDFQWIQQGLRETIYHLVETHELTKFNVFFTDQGPNQRGALLGSSTKRYATLDLKEASDRVHLDLVRLLFPEHVFRALAACRSSSTVLPDGKIQNLEKFAPMGSALCFPIMALTIWALLTATAPDADTRESILVYGDDVIVPTAFAESAMTTLELFGLKINHSKSCTQGSFRESCGVDAFNGIDVTPVRFRTVWSESPRPDVYTSWIAYANQLWDRQCYTAYEYIVARLEAIYGPIPGEDMHLACPSLRCASATKRDFKSRPNMHLQKMQYKVRVVKSPSVHQPIDGWSMLLRFFTEGHKAKPSSLQNKVEGKFSHLMEEPPFSVSKYTKRHTSMLVWRWR